MNQGKEKFIEYGSALFTMQGQSRSGDKCFVSIFSDYGLMAVVDGLGHGERAYKAAKTAIETIKNDPKLPVTELIKNCHEEMVRTCGAVIFIAAIDIKAGIMTWAGVGNVEGILLRKKGKTLMEEPLLSSSGIVGYSQLPPIKVSVIPVFSEDILIFNTDGINGGFIKNINLDDSPRFIAEYILKHYGKGTDDAAVLVARLRKNSINFGDIQCCACVCGRANEIDFSCLVINIFKDVKFAKLIRIINCIKN